MYDAYKLTWNTQTLGWDLTDRTILIAHFYGFPPDRPQIGPNLARQHADQYLGTPQQWQATPGPNYYAPR